MKICNACGAKYDDTFRFCPADGMPLRETVVAEVEEVSCGEEFHVDPSHLKKEFALTLMESGNLPSRLAVEIRYFQSELKHIWPEFKRDPVGFGLSSARKCVFVVKRQILAPNVAAGILSACLIVTSIVVGVFLVERRARSSSDLEVANRDDATQEVAMIELGCLSQPDKSKGVGLAGTGRVGFQRDKGEGSSPQQRRAQGGGSGGNHDLFVAQAGKLPQPSVIPAAIPKLPPINKTTLPAAGIDIDPALWQDIKAPVYGDPRSKSQISSNGPGDGGGMGTNQGTGIGDGRGPGVGPGEDGNIGGGPRQIGGRGPGGSTGNNPDPDRVWAVKEVEQKARLLSKPEPHYSEEARRNQITGTVVLRVVFSSSGEVSNIRAVSLLPFGLTERAIDAARQIRFVPATRGGRPVSVYMQLEYNFNLY
jgi:TonB family protein